MIKIQNSRIELDILKKPFIILSSTNNIIYNNSNKINVDKNKNKNIDESTLKLMKLLFYLKMDNYMDDELIQIYKDNNQLISKNQNYKYIFRNNKFYNILRKSLKNKSFHK
jgi:hypothetical protein